MIYNELVSREEDLLDDGGTKKYEGKMGVDY